MIDMQCKHGINAIVQDASREGVWQKISRAISAWKQHAWTVVRLQVSITAILQTLRQPEERGGSKRSGAASAKV
ncbi:MAG: hypothetical protein IJZ08_05960, partial [Clostridia bacterium]|nr:hypothetical protein [Clostridia bacterium]